MKTLRLALAFVLALAGTIAHADTKFLFVAPGNTGTVDANVLIPCSTLCPPGVTNWPNAVNFYVPNNTPLSATVFLHGGSGTNVNFAYNLKVCLTFPCTNVSNINWTLLNGWRVLAAFPQGQAPLGGTNNCESTQPAPNAPNSTTWCNHAMDSGNNDVGFLEDLSAYITSHYGVGGVVSGKNLFGHSNGGMMVWRMLLEAPNFYAHYGVTSGPQSAYYLPQGLARGTVRPVWMEFGALDDVLCIDGDATGCSDGPGNQWYSYEWKQNIQQLSFADVAYPGPTFWISASYFAASWANQGCAAGLPNGPAGVPQIRVSDGVTTSVNIGTLTTWDYCSGTATDVTIRYLSSAGHDIASQEQALGARIVNQFFQWVKAN